MDFPQLLMLRSEAATVWEGSLDHTHPQVFRGSVIHLHNLPVPVANNKYIDRNQRMGCDGMHVSCSLMVQKIEDSRPPSSTAVERSIRRRRHPPEELIWFRSGLVGQIIPSSIPITKAEASVNHHIVYCLCTCSQLKSEHLAMLSLAIFSTVSCTYRNRKNKK